MMYFALNPECYPKNERERKKKKLEEEKKGPLFPMQSKIHMHMYVKQFCLILKIP